MTAPKFLKFTKLILIAKLGWSSPSLAQNNNVNYAEQLYAVSINQIEQPSVVIFLQDSQGNLLASKQDLIRWRLKLHQQTPIIYQNKAWFYLKNFPQMVTQIDPTTLSLRLTVPGNLFENSDLTIGETIKEPQYPSKNGSYLNYNLFSSSTNNRTTTSGLFEGVNFSRYGIISQSFLAQNSNELNNSPFVRLDTRWTLDNPQKMRSIHIGDNLSLPGSWGRSVNFGGIQWATNFGTNPYFKTTPFTSVRGEATIPSTIDIFVNNALVNRHAIQPGPFNINEIPLISGQGEVRVVTTDLQGKQQVTVLPYFAGTDLLRAGVHQYDYELGVIRNNYSTASNDYGRFMALAMDRVGINDSLTGEWRGEIVGKQQTAGLSATAAVFQAATVNASTAVSHSPKGLGGLLSLGIQHQSQSFNFGANLQYATHYFTQLGLQPDESPTHLQTQTFLGFPNVFHGNIGLSYIHQHYYDKPTVNILSANYNRSFSQSWFLGLTGLANLGTQAEKTIFLSISYVLDSQTSLNMDGQAGTTNSQSTIQLNRSLPSDTGFGYNITANMGNNTNQHAILYYQSPYGNYSLGAGHQNHTTDYQANAAGSLTLFDDHIYVNRTITSSFGIAKVADIPNITVYADNQPVGKTHKDGTLLIPNLRPYERSTLKINPNELPLDTQLMTNEVNVIPFLHSGVLANFEVNHSHNAIFKVVDMQNQPLSSETRVVNQAQQEFPIGMNGEIFATQLNEVTRFSASWEDKTCHFTISYPKTDELIPDLGVIVCK